MKIVNTVYAGEIIETKWVCDWTDPDLMWIYHADAEDRDPGDEAA